MRYLCYCMVPLNAEWVITKTEKRKLDAFDMGMLETTVAVRLDAFVCYEEIREKLCKPPFSFKLRNAILKWFEHIERIGEEWQVNRISNAEMQGSRQVRRQRTRWKDVLREDLMVSGLSHEEAATEAADRNRWRTNVTYSCAYNAAVSWVEVNKLTLRQQSPAAYNCRSFCTEWKFLQFVCFITDRLATQLPEDGGSSSYCSQKVRKSEKTGLTLCFFCKESTFSIDESQKKFQGFWTNKLAQRKLDLHSHNMSFNKSRILVSSPCLNSLSYFFKIELKHVSDLRNQFYDIVC